MASVVKKERSACARCGTFFSPSMLCDSGKFSLMQQTRTTDMSDVDNYLIRCVEALTRAGEVDRRLLPKAINMFEVRNQHLPSDIHFLFIYTCVIF